MKIGKVEHYGDQGDQMFLTKNRPTPTKIKYLPTYLSM
jgi:hypothetical protein